MRKRTFDIGKITCAHGLRGEVKVCPVTHDLDNLKRQEYFLMGHTRLDVESIREQKGKLVVKFRGVGDRDAATLLIGRWLSILRECATPLHEGRYYMEDLLGMEVYEEGSFLGVVDNILETGSNEVLQVRGEQGEILIPMIRDVVHRVDLDLDRIHVSWVKGMNDLD